jgi:hypothetical protein
MTTLPESVTPAKPEANLAKRDWNKPRPEVIPRSTYFPAAMAFGITFFLWGLVTSPVVLGMGLLVFAFSLAGWIGEMRHDK